MGSFGHFLETKIQRAMRFPSGRKQNRHHARLWPAGERILLSVSSVSLRHVSIDVPEEEDRVATC